MTNEQRNGDQPVYPTLDGGLNGLTLREWGMTKRELFAAMAMQGLAAAGGYNPTEHDNVAHWAVKQADALLTALDQTHG